MPTFPSRKFRPSFAQHTIPALYRTALNQHPFLLFGLPFLATMVAGSFFLTPATAIRYEKHDRKIRQVSKEEELGIGKDRRKVDMNEEYYRLAAKVSDRFGDEDLDNWENKRVKRLKGEHDGIL
ncbi:Cytochrome oxidase assembly [Varicellaria rhodocarpa]|nr:Cytochrome oxidase assembly [Varicellaria rhodocarpa]